MQLEFYLFLNTTYSHFSKKEKKKESSLLLRVFLARGYIFLIKAFFFSLKKYYLITNLVLIFKNK